MYICSIFGAAPTTPPQVTPPLPILARGWGRSRAHPGPSSSPPPLPAPRRLAPLAPPPLLSQPVRRGNSPRRPHASPPPFHPPHAPAGRVTAPDRCIVHTERFAPPLLRWVP